MIQFRRNMTTKKASGTCSSGILTHMKKTISDANLRSLETKKRAKTSKSLTGILLPQRRMNITDSKVRRSGIITIRFLNIMSLITTGIQVLMKRSTLGGNLHNTKTCIRIGTNNTITITISRNSLTKGICITTWMSTKKHQQNKDGAITPWNLSIRPLVRPALIRMMSTFIFIVRKRNLVPRMT